MKITLENIGQIKKAEIDLSKDLIVLCGGNNTGKTYAAYTVYGLFRFLEKLAKKATLKGINDKLKTLLITGSVNLNLEEVFLAEKQNIINIIKLGYVDYLATVFASPKDFFKYAQIDVKIDERIALSEISFFEIDTVRKFSPQTTATFNKERGSLLINITTVSEDEDTLTALSIIKEISNSISHIIFQTFSDDAYIAPAERLAINIFSRELSEKRNKLVDDVLNFDKNQDASDYIGKNATRYSLPIKDSLQLAEKLDVLQKEKSKFTYLADEIETNILKGKMKISEYGGVTFNPDKTQLNLDINLTASGVKSLASIIFYLRHLAKVGDFYIIDEPELNLHPDNQRKIARIIAQMVNAGIKVMISTHSNYIIRELNNLIMLNVNNKENKKEATKLLEKYGYQKEEILDYNKVGAYLFTSNFTKILVSNLEVTNTGFEIATIDKETEELNESSSDIFFTLHND